MSVEMRTRRKIQQANTDRSFFGDFVCRSCKLVVEIDGYSHDFRVEQDNVRKAFDEAQGYRIIRFSNGDVMKKLEGVLIATKEALAAMSLPTPNPSRLRAGDKRNMSLPSRLREGPGVGEQ